MHHQNIQILLIEIYKAINDLPGATTKDLFTRTQYSYSLPRQQEVLIPKVKAVLKGQNSIRYFGAIIWNSLPLDIRKIDSLDNISHFDILSACLGMSKQLIMESGTNLDKKSI